MDIIIQVLWGTPPKQSPNTLAYFSTTTQWIDQKARGNVDKEAFYKIACLTYQLLYEGVGKCHPDNPLTSRFRLKQCLLVGALTVFVQLSAY